MYIFSVIFLVLVLLTSGYMWVEYNRGAKPNGSLFLKSQWIFLFAILHAELFFYLVRIFLFFLKDNDSAVVDVSLRLLVYMENTAIARKYDQVQAVLIKISLIYC